jgi:hypothetical protein
MLALGLAETEADGLDDGDADGDENSMSSATSST